MQFAIPVAIKLQFTSMNIVLATGIYPPDIGGPATYTAGLENELRARGHDVIVLTYGRVMSGHSLKQGNGFVRVGIGGNMIVRWLRYRKALRTHAQRADAVIAMTSVSVGVPLLLSGLKEPKKILRLGGDFFWERYTATGGTLGLAEWHRSRFGFWRLLNTFFMHGILSSFDAVVYSTAFQQKIHAAAYRHLPPVAVIENAVPESRHVSHAAHKPFRLLFVGRLVRFKQVSLLVEALSALPDVMLTITGSGPEQKHLLEQVRKLGLRERVTFLPPVFGEAKQKLFAEHDLLVLPSVTEISPNVALEAASAGLPVLLTVETGLSDALSAGMTKAPMRSKMEIASAVTKIRATYAALGRTVPPTRSWAQVADAWVTLLSA